MFKEGDVIKIIKDNFSVHGLYEDDPITIGSIGKIIYLMDDLAEVEVDDYLYLIKLDCCKKMEMWKLICTSVATYIYLYILIATQVQNL